MLKSNLKSTLDPSETALKYLSYMAEDGERLGRFMSLTGIAPQDLKASLPELAFHAAILDYALQDETQLLAFAANHEIDPMAIVRARQKLPGAES